MFCDGLAQIGIDVSGQRWKVARAARLNSLATPSAASSTDCRAAGLSGDRLNSAKLLKRLSIAAGMPEPPLTSKKLSIWVSGLPAA